MKFLKKGVEYNKLAKAFNGIYQMLQDVIQKMQYEDAQNDIFVLAYIGRREIIDRMEEFNWDINSSIIIPMMPGKQKTLAYAYQQTILKILELGETEGYSEEVTEILDKGNLYSELDNKMPDHIKKMMS